MAEVAEIRGHVQREPMHRHPPVGAHPDGGDLPRCGPDSGVAGLGPRLDSEIVQRRDQHLLDPPNVTDDVETTGKPGNGTDGISDELAGAVIGDVTASVDGMEFGLQVGEDGSIHLQVRTVPVSPDGVRVGMLQQQEVVVSSAAVGPPIPDGALQVPRLCVPEPPEPADPQLSTVPRRHASSCSQSQVSRFCWIRRRKSTAVEPSKAR